MPEFYIQNEIIISLVLTFPFFCGVGTAVADVDKLFYIHRKENLFSPLDKN